MNKFLLSLIFIFFFQVANASGIRLVEPKTGAILKEGEINIQWIRPKGDKSPVKLEVRAKKNQLVVLERTTIGTRRTKWLSPGDYQVRLSKNAKVEDRSWRDFTVVSRESKMGVISTKRRIKRQEKRKEKIKGRRTLKKITPKANIVKKVGEKETDLNFFDEMVMVKKHLVGQAKDPQSLEVLKWYAPEKDKEGIVRIRVQFRAKNTFGELKEQDFLYQLKNQKIQEVKSLKALD